VTELDDFARDLLSVAPTVVDLLTEWDDGLSPDPEMPTVWMGYAGRAVAKSLDRLSPEQQRGAFEVIERYLANGSELTKTCVTTGLLEAVANAVSGGRLDGPHLATLLGPESRAYIDAWDQFTLGRSSLDPS